MRRLVEQIEEPVIGELFQCWQRSVPSDAAIPTRRDIDPVNLGHLLPFVALIEILSEPPWLRCRVAGSEVEQHFGRSLRNATLDDLASVGQEV